MAKLLSLQVQDLCNRGEARWLACGSSLRNHTAEVKCSFQKGQRTRKESCRREKERSVKSSRVEMTLCLNRSRTGNEVAQASRELTEEIKKVSCPERRAVLVSSGVD